MITLDQIALLEQKIESAVEKIQQLQAENDALRSKCTELTNALSAKSEQLTSFETDQNQIEAGIKKALDRLNAIENSVLKAGEVISSKGQAASTLQNTVPTKEQPVHIISHDFGSKPSEVNTTSISTIQMTESYEPVVTEQDSEPVFENFAPSFDTMDNLNSNSQETFEPKTSFEAQEAFESNNSFESNESNETFESEELFESNEPFDSNEDNQDGLGFDIF